MYRSPMRPFSAASKWPAATSSTGATFNPVSTYAGILPFRKSRMICPVGVGFQSPGPTGAVGFTITTGSPARGRLHRFVLRQKFRALVVPDHFVESRCGVSSFGSAPVTRHRDRRHRAGVNNALDARIRRNLEKPPRPVDVALVNLFRDRESTAGNPPPREKRGERPSSRDRAKQDRANRLRRVRRASLPERFRLLLGPHQTRTRLPALTSCRATWLPTNPVAPVTSVSANPGRPRAGIETRR